MGPLAFAQMDNPMATRPTTIGSMGAWNPVVAWTVDEATGLVTINIRAPGRKPIAGSCGGIANLGIEKECSICGGSREKCEEVNREQKGDVVDAKLAYDATKR